MAPKVNELQVRLDNLTQLLAAGTISQSEHDDSRAAALGLSLKPTGAVSVENNESKSRRELLSLLAKWVGTKDAPTLAHDLHDAVMNTTADEGLRRQIAELTTANRLAIELTAAFKATPKGKMPAAFDSGGAAPTMAMTFARLAARQFLLGLAAALAVSQANKLEMMRDKLCGKRLCL